MKNQKGVTLLELIIVMVIIAIGATLMAPGISSWMPHYRLRSATRDIVSTMRVAQIKAKAVKDRWMTEKGKLTQMGFLAVEKLT